MSRCGLLLRQDGQQEAPREKMSKSYRSYLKVDMKKAPCGALMDFKKTAQWLQPPPQLPSPSQSSVAPTNRPQSGHSSDEPMRAAPQAGQIPCLSFSSGSSSPGLAFFRR